MDQRAFIDSAVTSNQDVILDDDRGSVDRLQHPSDLCGCAQVNAFANLRAGANQCVGVDHRAFIDRLPTLHEDGGIQITEGAI